MSERLQDGGQVAVGGGHSCARKSDGTLWCWGGNYCGQLGINQFSGLYAAKPLPMQAGAFTLGSDVAEVALGGKQFVVFQEPNQEHSCARKTDGTLWCWGNNDYGQLGNGTTISKSTPVPTPPSLAMTLLRSRLVGFTRVHAKPTAQYGVGAPTIGANSALERRATWPSQCKQG
ncbi:MAG: hypothetical protein IPM54_21105 [Polyangiaceae bacterium]|nr:hypothetical protein [Polyangiaceae bacterium]